jgi:hypothetical protein
MTIPIGSLLRRLEKNRPDPGVNPVQPTRRRVVLVQPSTLSTMPYTPSAPPGKQEPPTDQGW